MEYKIQGETAPVVICQLSPGESMVTEKGSAPGLPEEGRVEK